MEGKGIRCVTDEPWVTASETAECALAFAAIGDRDTATDLLAWTRAHRRDDGAYWTGLVHDRRRTGALPVRGAHVLHRGSGDPGRRRDRRCIAGGLAVHPAPDGRRRLIEEGAMGEGGDERVDVLVIGAGISGIDAAYHLQTYCPGRTFAGDAAHVTMLQRSPTYVVSRPERDAIANGLRRVPPCGWRMPSPGARTSRCNS